MNTSVKTSTLTANALAWAIAKCEGEEIVIKDGECWYPYGSQFCETGIYWPENNSDLCMKIMVEEHISVAELDCFDEPWAATANVSLLDKNQDGDICHILYNDFLVFGPTPELAVLRCYLERKLGKEIEIPDEIINHPRNQTGPAMTPR